jgi:hypothetical protein
MGKFNTSNNENTSKAIYRVHTGTEKKRSTVINVCCPGRADFKSLGTMSRLTNFNCGVMVLLPKSCDVKPTRPYPCAITTRVELESFVSVH